MNIKSSGCIENCISDSTLEFLVSFIKKNAPLNTDSHHSKSYSWYITRENFTVLEKLIIKEVGHYFDPMKIVTITYKECNDSFGPHFDNYIVNEHGVPYVSLLFPITDGIFTTFIFDQKSKLNSRGIEENMEYAKNLPDQPVSVMQPGLEHIAEFWHYKLTVENAISWKKNSCIYWANESLHCGSYHNKELIDFKKFIVIHTTRK